MFHRFFTHKFQMKFQLDTSNNLNSAFEQLNIRSSRRKSNIYMKRSLSNTKPIEKSKQQLNQNRKSHLGSTPNKILKNVSKNNSSIASFSNKKSVSSYSPNEKSENSSDKKLKSNMNIYYSLKES